MKTLKLLSIAAGAIATFTIAATPKAALGQTPLQAQPNPGTSLTREQQIQFQQLQENAIAQIDAVLTPQQRTQFAAARVRGEGLDIQSLSQEQKKQIIKIILSLDSRIENILKLEER